MATAVTALAGGLKLASVVMGGLQQSRNARYQSQVAANNALIKERQAVRTRFEGQLAAQDADFEAASVIANIQARNSASGVELGFGSRNFQVDAEREVANLNRMRILTRAEQAAVNAQTEAQNFRNESTALRRRSRSIIGGTLLTGLSTIASTAYDIEDANPGTFKGLFT